MSFVIKDHFSNLLNQNWHKSTFVHVQMLLCTPIWFATPLGQRQTKAKKNKHSDHTWDFTGNTANPEKRGTEVAYVKTLYHFPIE